MHAHIKHKKVNDFTEIFMLCEFPYQPKSKLKKNNLCTFRSIKEKRNIVKLTPQNL